MGSLPVSGAVQGISFSRASKFLALACTECTEIWDLKGPKLHTTVRSRSPLTSVSFAPDDSVLACTSAGGGLALHKKEDGGRLASTCDVGWTHLASAAYALGAPLLAAVGNGGAAVWDAGSLQRMDAFPDLHRATLSKALPRCAAVRFLGTGGETLVSVGADGRCVLTDRRLGSAVAAAEAAGALTALDARADGGCLAVGTAAGAVLLYDPRKLAAPVARLPADPTNPGANPGVAAVLAMHWQHTPAEIEARRAAPAATPITSADAAATPMLGLPPQRAATAGAAYGPAASPAADIQRRLDLGGAGATPNPAGLQSGAAGVAGATDMRRLELELTRRLHCHENEMLEAVAALAAQQRAMEARIVALAEEVAEVSQAREYATLWLGE
ncbi:hypothetical protein WJX81_007130 [Elliptochloris bilobata]|uniref:Uncharacterized protein n=1 Tax=Elliptochloris bilobata TaxID=381761 RepID=A0AAW1RIF5_9CHLO